MENNQKLELILKTAEDKLGQDIKVINIDESMGICDQFVLITGRNKNHTQALSDYIVEKLEETDQAPLRVEGFREGSWILIDCADTIVHIFTADQRDFYNLEELWKN